MPTVGRLKDGELLIRGEVSERLPMVVDGLVAHYPLDGTDKGKSFKNLLDLSDWKEGTSGTQGGFLENGEGNQIVQGVNPWNYEEPLWEGTREDTESGWDHNGVAIDKTKKYRLTVWMKREVVGNGTSTFGCQGSTVHRLTDSVVESAPYFISGDFPETQGEWVLFVGYIHPWNYSGGTDTTNGVYKRDGVKTRSGQDFKWAPSATVGGHSTHLLYSTDTTTIPRWARPRMEICDGTECTIEELLNGEEDTIGSRGASNLTWEPDKVAIEEETVNRVLKDGQDGSCPWGGDGSPSKRVMDPILTFRGRRVARYIPGASGNMYLNGTSNISNAVSSTEWTSSLYIRRLDGKAITSINTYLYVSGNTNVNDVATTLEEVEDGWYRVTRTRTGLVSGTVSLFGVYGMELGTEYLVADWQLEAKGFATAYTSGTRAARGELQLPNEVIDFTEGTISCWFKPSQGFFSKDNWNRVFGHATTTNRNEIQVKRNGTGNNLVMSISNDAGTPQTSWSACPSGNISPNTWYHIVARWSFITNQMSLTVNNVSNSNALTETYKPSNRGVFAVGYHPNASRNSNSGFKDLSVYNRYLTDKEIELLYGKAYDITEDGKVKTKQVIERPNGIPRDAVYIPMDTESKDRLLQITPVAETNTVYEEGSVWVGRAATNLLYDNGVMNGSFDTLTLTPTVSALIPNERYLIKTNRNGTSETIRFLVPLSKLVNGTTYTMSYKYRIIKGTKFDMLDWCDASVTRTTRDMGSYMIQRATGTRAAYDSSYRFMDIAVDPDSEIEIWDMQLEASTFETPYVKGTRGEGELEFNLHASHGLKWNEDWSIVYWKKPIATNLNGLTGYSLDTLGRNSNTAGGGYIWWGKNSGTNVIQGSTPGTIDPNKYFRQWRMISLVKSGSTLTIKEWETDGTVYIRTVSMTTSVQNFYVTQDGYDLKLAGWDNANACNAYYRDMVIAKRAFTEDELKTMVNTQMRMKGSGLQIQKGIRENQNL